MNTQIFEEATDWLIRHREADLTAQEKREFDAWLRASPQHLRAYLEMSALWEDVPALDPHRNPAPDELIATARSEGNVYLMTEAGRPVPRTAPAGPVVTKGARPGMRALAVAAAVLVAVVGATSGYWLNRNTYSTEIGEQRSIDLADGSIVELNSRSRVRIRYSEARRDVDLIEGQALFRVAHNTARPFIVHSGAANVRAVGTQFDVYRKRAGTIVTVVEGKVAVLASTLAATGPDSRREGAAVAGVAGNATGATAQVTPRAALTRQIAWEREAGNAIFLGAGEQLTVPADKTLRDTGPAAVEAPQRANVAAATAWTHRTLVFETSPLTDVAEEFNRYTTRQLVVADAGLADIHISGTFSSVDPALLLKFLRTQAEINVDETETEIRISRK